MRTILTAALVMVVAGPASSQDTVYKMGEGVTAPVLVKEVKPNYTESAMRRRVEGVVELSVVVRSDGTVDDDVAITRSLDDELDQEAIKAVRQWRFRPGTVDGKPVNVQVKIEMSFSLKKSRD